MSNRPWEYGVTVVTSPQRYEDMKDLPELCSHWEEDENGEENETYHVDPVLMTCWDHSPEYPYPESFPLESNFYDACLCKIRCENCGWELHGLEWSSNTGHGEALDMLERVADGTFDGEYFIDECFVRYENETSQAYRALDSLNALKSRLEDIKSPHKDDTLLNLELVENDLNQYLGKLNEPST